MFFCFLIDVILFTFQRSVSIVIDDDDDDDSNNDGIVEHVILPPICKLLLSAYASSMSTYLLFVNS